MRRFALVGLGPLGRMWLAFAAAAGLVAVPRPLAAQEDDLSVKAAFLAKFPAYVTWPSQVRSSGPFWICIVGDDPFGRALDAAIHGRQAGGQPIHIRKHANVADAVGCRMAFVHGGSADATAALLQGLANQPVLTVTDARFGPSEGMIHFESIGGRVRFRIDEAAAQRSGLSISSRLLDLALSVKRAR